MEIPPAVEAGGRRSLAIEPRELAYRVRKDCVRMTAKANSSHIGSALSAVDLLAVLFARHLRFDPKRPQWPERDRFILSKGHGCAALYSILAEAGYFDPALLSTYYEDGSPFVGHATHKGVPGVEVSTGSLGHGLSIATGMALALQRDGQAQRPSDAERARQTERFVCMLSDGECDEGSVWEAALFAAHHRLDRLVAIVDHNKIQSFGSVAEVLDLAPLADKWRSFGWGVRELDGHDLEAIDAAFAALPFEAGRPSAIVAHTVKGKGVSFMEGELLWHYRAPRGELEAKAIAEIEAAYAAASAGTAP